ncbi:MAG: uroporphyrinogen-III synthase [Hyphomonadaceae bacterium]|nr:uroporphyrinogen-III synthase [Hyphomonadaceae bacterium]
MRRVAITRALPEAERTAQHVRDFGATPIVAPLLTIVPCGYDTSTQDAQALVFTSSNGVHAFPNARGARDMPVFAVGETTAAAARAAGFLSVRSANGDVNALAALIKSTLSPAGGKLIHIGGAHLAGDLAGQLAQSGFTLDRRVAYAAVPASVAPAAFAEPLDLVLFHSARAAETFIALGAPGSERLVAGCLSPAVAEAARAARWKALIVSPAPREDALLGATLRE